MAGELVLVADDSRENVKFLCDYILEPNGYKTLTAMDGEQGLRYALSHDIDLLIIDLKMPRMTGLEVMQALREKGKDLPIILMTFYGSEETAIQAFRLGAKDYLIKPFTVTEALDAIERALVERRLRKEKEKLEGGVLQINQQLAQRVKELNILYTIGKSVAQLVELETALNRIVEAGVYITGAEEGSLLLIDEESGELYLRAARGLGEKFARGFRLKVSDSLAGKTVQTGEPVRMDVSTLDQSLKIKTGYLVKAALNVPLKVGSRVIGVLCVDNKVASRPFSENDQKLLSALADYASISIVNAQLFQELRKSRDEIQRWSVELERRVRERTDELRNVQSQLIRAEQLASIGQLAAGVAHEINNPLGVILGFAETLSEQAKPGDVSYEPLKLIERETLRCKRIVQNLLDFSRHSELTLARTDLRRVIEATLALLAVQIAQQGIQVDRIYADNLPLLLADAQQLQQVFTNIAVNAIQAMPQGGKLSLSAQMEGREAVVRIRDTGAGISPENLSRIFDPFFTTKEVGQGAGLGLSVSFAIIKRHGGAIEVESAPGKGSCFAIKIPLTGPSGNLQPSS
jgi:signal transduction histidine kinase/DNA-binding response OmpR family regulator